MDCLQKADRRSLLTEIEDLRAQINGRKITLEREQEIEKPSQGVCIPGSLDPVAGSVGCVAFPLRPLPVSFSPHERDCYY